LQYGPQRPDAPALPYVGMLAESVFRREDVWPRLQLGETRWTARPRRLGLEPVQEAQAHALGVLQGARLLERGAVEEALVAVVVAGPIEHADVVGVATGRREEARVNQAAVGPQRALGARGLL